MFKGKSIVAIIPCHNEGPRIQGVLKAVCKSKYLDGVIVIDDCSDDNSYAKIIEYSKSVTCLRHKKNKGKLGAVLAGVSKSDSDYLFFIDADLIGLKVKYIDKSIEECIHKNLDMLLLPVGGSLQITDKISEFFGTTIVITGQRIIKRTCFTKAISANKRGVKGYGLELYLNNFAKQHSWKVDVILWGKNMTPITPYKTQKFGLIKGISKEFRMFSEMFAEFSLLDYFSDLKLFIKKQ